MWFKKSPGEFCDRSKALTRGGGASFAVSAAFMADGGNGQRVSFFVSTLLLGSFWREDGWRFRKRGTSRTHSGGYARLSLIANAIRNWVGRLEVDVHASKLSFYGAIGISDIEHFGVSQIKKGFQGTLFVKHFNVLFHNIDSTPGGLAAKKLDACLVAEKKSKQHRNEKNTRR